MSITLILCRDRASVKHLIADPANLPSGNGHFEIADTQADKLIRLR